MSDGYSTFDNKKVSIFEKGETYQPDTLAGPYQIQRGKMPEQSVIISVSLLMDLYAELHNSRPDLAERLKKCITGEK